MFALMMLATAAIAIPTGFRETVEKYWHFDELSKTPDCRPCPHEECAFPGMDALLLKGKGPKNTTAEFFAYYARPQGNVPPGGFPAVLLTHGGGGTAFPIAIDQWRKAGFVVMATDWYNQMPAPGLTNAATSESSLPRVDLPGGKRNDIWANIANLVLAHSYLRSRSEVNQKKTVFVGLSWGSWYGSTLTALDPRFRGVVNIYCGDVKTAKDTSLYLVNGRFLHAAKCPTWWVVGTNDGNVSPATSQTGFEECARCYGHAMIPRLPHSHIGFEFGSVMRMAKHFTSGEPSLPILGPTKICGCTASAKILKHGKSVGRAVLHYTRDRDTRKTSERKWIESSAKVADDVVSAEIPSDAFQAYLSLYEKDEGRFHDLCGSSDVLEFRGKHEEGP